MREAAVSGTFPIACVFILPFHPFAVEAGAILGCATGHFSWQETDLGDCKGIKRFQTDLRINGLYFGFVEKSKAAAVEQLHETWHKCGANRGLYLA